MLITTNYAINYNKIKKMLEFNHEFFSNSTISPLKGLFNNFGHSLTKIISDIYNLSVYHLSYCDYEYNVCNVIFYTDDIQCNEKITDILFLHEKYRYYISHYPGPLTQEQFVYWQNAIKGVDKPAILKMLYEDKKISEHYLLKYSVYNPSFLYELAKYSLFINMCGEKAVQTEKIDKLPLPRLIKEDIKLIFLR